MKKVMHLKNDALLGRYPHERIRQLFLEHSVEYYFGEQFEKDFWQDPLKIVRVCNDNKMDWLFYNWEKFETSFYKAMYEAPRSFKIVLFGHEQPQALLNLRANQRYADYVITSSPIYKNEVHGFLPFGIHTYYLQQPKIPFESKQKRILISGSYRHSRGQLFEWALANQPFKWPVYFFSPNFKANQVEKDETRRIVSRYPKYVYQQARDAKDYIPNLLNHLNTHGFFIDFTTNSTNHLKFHEDFQVIMSQAKDLPGGYCPERVLDALWLGSPSWCLYDKAVVYLLGDRVNLYSNLDELVASVNYAIDNPLWAKEQSLKGQEITTTLTTEAIIARLARFFNTGVLDGY